MHLSSSVLFLAAAGLAAQVSGASIGKLGVVGGLDYSLDLRYGKRHKRQDGGGNGGGNGNGGNENNGGSQTCLAADALQTASAETGQDGEIPEGQVESKTDDANFINFCSGQTLTNGLQNVDGSCNGVVMGKIPAKSNMVSAIIISPGPGEQITSDTTFDIKVQTRGLAAGSFTNAAKSYYTAPQDLDNQGNIIGHTHVTVQDLGGSFTPDQPLDPTTFAFFKGINDAGDGKGLLSATISGGLPPGFYRVCTMTAAANHQPVMMPVAQRGAQDDCNKFEVKAGNGGGGGGGGGGDVVDNTDPNSDDDPSNDTIENGGGADTGNQDQNQGDGGNNAGNNNGDNAGNNNGDNAGNNNGDNAGNNNGDNAGNNNGDNAGNNEGNNAGNNDGNSGNDGSKKNGGGRGKGGRGRKQSNAGDVPDTNENFVATTSADEPTKTAAPVGGGGADGEDKGNQDGAQDQGDASTDPAAEDPAETSAPDTQAPDLAEAVNSGDLGGKAPSIEDSGDAKRPFRVGNDTFVNKAAAVQRSCDRQFNACADAANSGRLGGKSVQDCEAQKQTCGK